MLSRELQEVMHPCMDTKYETTTVYWPSFVGENYANISFSATVTVAALKDIGNISHFD